MIKQIVLAMTLLLAAPPLQATAPVLESDLGRVVDQCKTKDPKKHVWIIKQWHLSPSVDTHTQKKAVPQLENQKAIYLQIAKWINENMLNTVYSEGCTGEITESFSKVFNGWSYKDLAAAAQTKDYADVVTLIPLKLKAQFKNKAHVFCADDENIIRSQSSVLSDARGNAGFLTRLEQFKDQPARAKPYLNKVIELDHLSADATPEVAIKRLKKDLADEIQSVRKGIDDRNAIFAKTLATGPSESVLVVGGIHASGLMDLLKKSEIDCSVIEPLGYKKEDEEAVLSFLAQDHR